MQHELQLLGPTRPIDDVSATHVQAGISNNASTSLSASQSYSAHADVSDV